MEQTWLPIPDYEGYYEVSDSGEIRRVKGWNGEGNILAKVPDRDGYLKVHLSVNGKAKKRLVHRLVMRAFIGESNLEVDHLNGNKQDNRLSNLEYVTTSENQLRLKDRSGRKSGTRGVSWHKQNQKWQVEFRVGNKRNYVGIYDTIEQASEAYKKAINEHPTDTAKRSNQIR